MSSHTAPALRSRRSRWRRGLIALGVLALVLGLTFTLGVPYAVRLALEGPLARELGRTVRVASVSANPFLLRVTLRGLTIAEADAQEPFFAVERLAVNASTLSVVYRAPVIDAVEIDTPVLRVVRLAAQRFNFSDMIERLQARPKGEDAGPARFAVYNIELRDGRVEFEDRTLGQRHSATELSLGVPFVSSLPADVAVKVLPALSARIDGTPLELRGETRPFEQTQESTLQLRLDGLDLPTYLGFAPVPLDFALPSGKLDTDLTIAFRGPLAARDGQPARPAELVVSGALGVRELVLKAPRKDGASLLQFKALQVRIAELAPFAQRLRIDDLALSAPEAWVTRASDGQLNWLRFAQSAVPSSANAPHDKAAAAAPPWRVQLGKLAVADGTVHWRDDSVGHFEQDLVNLRLSALGLDTREGAPPGQVELRLNLAPQGAIALGGALSLAPLGGQLDFAADDVQLRLSARYLAQVADATIDGASDVKGKLAIATDGGQIAVQLRDVAGQGRKLSLRGPKDSGAAVDIARLQIDGAALDLVKREFSVAAIAIEAPKVGIKRLADGELGWMQVVRPQSSPAAAGRETLAPAPAAAAGAAPVWGVKIDRVEVTGGQVNWEDESVSPPAKLAIAALQGSARDFSLEGKSPAQLSLRGRLAGATRGQFAVDGSGQMQPLRADVRSVLRNVDLAQLRPYLAQHLNATLVSAELSSKSRMRLAQAGKEAPLRVQVESDLRLANLHALDPAGEDLLKWQALDIDRIGVRLGEGAPDVQLGTIALADFFARVIVSAEGRLNLADLVPARGQVPGDTPNATPAAAPPPVAAATSGERPNIRIERVALARGNINFTDNFIKPNYTANLTDISGGVTTLASNATEPATLQLDGSVDREAPVSISGRISPLAPKTFLDIRGSTKGVDLPRFTPYAAKYAGYPITKGKLSLDVSYSIDNDQLKANNHLFLDQLTFGERVDSPSATKLPVLLAVALLKNSKGEIDINLPISGTLNDPEFSVGGIIVKVIVNLLGKVVTAPFALLGAAFGGGEELGYVDFAPGSAQLQAAQAQRVDTLAKALNDRPGLRLDIIGRASSTADTPGVRRAQLEARLRAAKVRQQIRSGGGSVAPDSVTVAPAERAALLAEVYGDDKVVVKPRNAIGLARTLPAAEMEQLLLESISVTQTELRALANSRAAAVRDQLEQQGKVPRERLFLVEPKVDAADEPNAKGAPTRVDFSLK